MENGNYGKCIIDNGKWKMEKWKMEIMRNG